MCIRDRANTYATKTAVTSEISTKIGTLDIADAAVEDGQKQPARSVTPQQWQRMWIAEERALCPVCPIRLKMN